MARAVTLLAAVAVLVLSGCSGGEDGGGGACVQDLDLACAPLYTPSFANLHAQTLAPSCGISGGSCHSAQGAQGGLVLDDADVAYALLLGSNGAPQRVIPGDPACSLVVRKLHADSPSEVMPPGAPLSEAERCVFVRWIDAGAAR